MSIIPFVGYDSYKLYQSIDDTKTVIKEQGLCFTTEVWDNKGCSNPVPWVIIRVENKIHLFFANNRLFKIYLDNDCEGSLPNGIHIGMPMQEAVKIDNSLEYDDWEEDYQSKEGYWIEDELETNTVMSISIFIKEALNEDEFDKYEW